MIRNATDNSGKPRKALELFDSLLGGSGQSKPTGHQVALLLDTLANADDAGLVVRFPAVLAMCARKNLALNFRSMLSHYRETSARRQNLEKLLLASAAMFNINGLPLPENLAELTTSLKPKYSELLKTGQVQLSGGLRISLQDLQVSPEPGTAKLTTRPQSRKLDIYLNRLFSPKQKELVLKRRDGIAFTKTEREYFSRTVRKKLEAVADDEVSALARKLTHK